MNRPRMNSSRLAAALMLAAIPALMLAPAAHGQNATPAASAAPSPTLPPALAAKVEAHIKELHAKLGITAPERPQWDQFAQVMRDNAAAMHQAYDDRNTALASASAAQNMDSYVKLAEVHAANMQKLATAFQALYAALPDAQKRTADAVFREGGGTAMPGHPHRSRS